MRYAISIVLVKKIAKISFFSTGYFEDIRYEIPTFTCGLRLSDLLDQD